MKKTRWIFMVALIVLAGFSAWALTKESKPVFNSYFKYNGGAENLPGSYDKVNDLPGDCGNGDNMCAILAPEDGSTGHPAISGALQTRIDNRTTSAGDVFVKQ